MVVAASVLAFLIPAVLKILAPSASAAIPSSLGVGLALVLSVVGKLLHGQESSSGFRGSLILSVLSDIGLWVPQLVPGLGVYGGWGILFFATSPYFYLRYLESETERLPTGFARYLPRLLMGTAWTLPFLFLWMRSLFGLVLLGWILSYALSLWRIANPTISTRAGLQKSFFSKTLEGSPQEIESALDSVASADAKFEALRKWGFWGMVAAALLGVGGFVTLALLKPPDAEEYIVPLFSISMVIGVVSFVVWRLGKAGDLEDSWHLGLRRLHKHLATDLMPGGTCRYHLNTGSLTFPGNFRSLTRIGHWFWRPRGMMDTFVTPVISGQIQLRDGTQVRFELLKRVRRRKLHKTNRRGKWKSKVKLKYSEIYRVMIRFPKGKEPTLAPGSLPPVPPNLSRLVKPISLKFKVKKRRAILSVKSMSRSEPINVEGVLGLMAYAFHSQRAEAGSAPEG